MSDTIGGIGNEEVRFDTVGLRGGATTVIGLTQGNPAELQEETRPLELTRGPRNIGPARPSAGGNDRF